MPRWTRWTCRPCGRPSRAARSWSAPPDRSASPTIRPVARPRCRRSATSTPPADRCSRSPTRPTVWCSWYHYFEQVTAADIEENLRAIDEHDLAGRRRADRRRLEPRSRRGAGALARLRVAARPRRRDPRLGPTSRAVAGAVPGRDADHAGPRAPRLAGGSGRSQLGPGPRRPRPHPPRRAGPAARRARSAGRPGRGLPQARLPLRRCGARSRGTRTWTRWRPTAPGWRWSARRSAPTSTSSAAAHRCCPSVGLVDAMRVSPDTFHEGAEDGSAGLRGLMPLAARAWMQGRLWVNDPDCVVARPSYRLRERWATEAARFGGLPSFSDRVADLDDWGLATVRAMLAEGGSGAPLSAGPGARGCRARPGRGVGVTTLDPAALADRIAPYVELLYPDDDGEVLRVAGRAGRAVRRGAARPRGRAAHRADRLPDHLRRRHPASGARHRCTRWRRSCTTTSATWSATCTCCRCSRGPPTTASPWSTTAPSTPPWAAGPTWPSWRPSTR